MSAGRRRADLGAAAPARGTPQTSVGPLGALDRRGADALTRNVELALDRARRTGDPTLACCTLPLQPGVDPSAVAAASRAPGEPWFCFEQPERGGACVAGLGEAGRLGARGSGRFASVAQQLRALTREAQRVTIAERSGGAPGGVDVLGSREAPVAVGGFSFAVDGGGSPGWSELSAVSLIVPEVALVRPPHGGARLILSSSVAPDDTAEEVAARMHERLANLHQRPLPLLDPAPSGEYRVVSAMPPEHFETAVRHARDLIAAGEMKKIVLAREVQVHAPRPHDPAAILGALRDAFPSCFVYCLGRGSSTLLGASPELLVRREGQRVSTIALAGSARRSADPAVDAHIGEQLLRSPSYREEHEIVVRRIERDLRRLALWVTSAPEPELVKVVNIQHLGTPIRAQLAEPRDAIELLQALHPTPAVGGEPARRALELIPALEGLDRGLYAGPVGWTDATGDGEFCVALRCALLRDTVAHCYAGNGIVRDSDPAAELAETEVKLAALLPLLAG